MIDAHRGAFEYDWRSRFNQPLSAIGRSMSWGEAYRLTQRLSGDPSSQIAAEISGWEYPASHEVLMLMGVFDALEVARLGRKFKPIQRPWPDSKKRQAKPTVSQDVVLAALRMAGHSGPPPLAR